MSYLVCCSINYNLINIRYVISYWQLFMHNFNKGTIYVYILRYGMFGIFDQA